MSFLEQQFFYLPQLAARWGMPVDHIEYLGGSGKLEMSVRTGLVEIDYGRMVPQPDGTKKKTGTIKCYSGLLPLKTEDVHKLLGRGSMDIRRFRPPAGYDYRELGNEESSLTVETGDLVVARETALRFEKQHRLAVQTASLPEAADAIEPQSDHDLIQGLDYGVVVLGDHQWVFGQLQAEVVRLLHEASKTDHPWLNGKRLLGQAGAKTVRMKDLFKTQKNWQALILSNGRGLYRLNCDPRLFKQAA